MRPSNLLLATSLMLGGCAQQCAVTKALYSAIVHGSGAPPRAERSRIDARERQLLRELPDARITVLPVAVLGREVRHDTAAARALADGLRARRLGQATIDEHPVALPFEPQPNQAAILWSRLNALADSVRAHPRANADYVLLVDVMGAPERGSIGAVNLLVVTADGSIAYRRLWNSHQPLFKEVSPRSLDDVARMTVLALERGRMTP